jgi:hypothetical protein
LYKVIFITVAVVIVGCGCAVSKRTGNEIIGISQTDAKELIQFTEKQNITNSSFFIERGRISTSGEGGRINLLFTMKYAQPGNYLISLKSATGIEAFRVYIAKDTVLINDRINRVTLYGNPFDFERISGLPADLLKVSIGDIFISGRNGENIEKCIDNKLTVNDYFSGLIIKSIINCALGKTKSVLLTSGKLDEQITLLYSKYRNDNYKVPGRIEVNDFRRKVKIVIRIEKYSVPWIGDVEFIPGAGYKHKKLL